MKIVAWNIRGPVTVILYLKSGRFKKMSLDILFLSETKINANKTLNIFPKLSIQLL